MRKGVVFNPNYTNDNIGPPAAPPFVKFKLRLMFVMLSLVEESLSEASTWVWFLYTT